MESGKFAAEAVVAGAGAAGRCAAGAARCGSTRRGWPTSGAPTTASGAVFVKLIGRPAVMRACTRHGLPHPVLMRFVLKLLANLHDPAGGDASDRIINVLTRLTPAVR